MPTEDFTITDGIILATIAFSAFTIGATAATILVAKILGATAFLLFFGATLAAFSPITLAIVAVIGLFFGTLVFSGLILNIKSSYSSGDPELPLLDKDENHTSPLKYDPLPRINSNVVILGNMDVGKSAFLHALLADNFVELYKPTIMADYEVVKTSLPNQPISMGIYDCSGRSIEAATHLTYINQRTHVIVLVFDLTNLDSFRSINDWLTAAKQNAPNAKLVLVGTKAELAYERQVPREIAEQWATNHNASYLEVSAKTGYNVDIARQTIAKQCAAALNPKGSPMPDESSSLTSSV